jgi:hypothetical protein
MGNEWLGMPQVDPLGNRRFLRNPGNQTESASLLCRNTPIRIARRMSASEEGRRAATIRFPS